MNTAKIATALNTISVAFGELAEALNESSGVRAPDEGRGSAIPPGASSAPTFSDGLPVEEPPLFPGAFEGEERDFRPQPSLADESVEFRPPKPTAQDQLLAECPVHFKPWTIKEGGMSKNGKPYSAFWKCSAKNEDGSYCDKKPTREWVKTHDPEKALAAA